ncbi:MAG: LPS assembly lipoprotein LptE [Gemmatimonas sp.]
MTPSGAVRSSPLSGTRLLTRRWARAVLGTTALGGALLVSSCYKFAGGGGGFPSNLKTVAVLPFDNQTPSPELQRELTETMRKQFEGRLNLRDAPEDRADVIVRGTLTQYDVDLPATMSANATQLNIARRKLQLIVNVEIFNVRTGKPLLKQDGMTAEGTYPEGQEAEGRKIAIGTLVDQMVQRSQSQW